MDAGIVYRTDAAVSRRVEIALPCPAKGPPDRLPARPDRGIEERRGPPPSSAPSSRPPPARSTSATASSSSGRSRACSRARRRRPPLHPEGRPPQHRAHPSRWASPPPSRLARYRGPGKGAIETLLSLPLILPPTAVGLLLLEVLARRAPLGAWLAARGMEIVFTGKAVLARHGGHVLPPARPLRADRVRGGGPAARRPRPHAGLRSLRRLLSRDPSPRLARRPRGRRPRLLPRPRASSGRR